MDAFSRFMTKLFSYFGNFEEDNNKNIKHCECAPPKKEEKSLAQTFDYNSCLKLQENQKRNNPLNNSYAPPYPGTEETFKKLGHDYVRYQQEQDIAGEKARERCKDPSELYREMHELCLTEDERNREFWKKIHSATNKHNSSNSYIIHSLYPPSSSLFMPFAKSVNDKYIDKKMDALRMRQSGEHKQKMERMHAEGMVMMDNHWAKMDTMRNRKFI